MKLFLLAVFSFISINAISQTSNQELHIVYNNSGTNIVMNGTHTINVYSTPKYSINIFKHEYTIRPHGTNGENDIPHERVNLMYKDYKMGTLKYIDFYPNRAEALIQETIPKIKWNFTKKIKKILGYNCQEAKCTFRGRQYTAFFTTEIPFKTSPWKLNGLPGVVLEVFSIDNFVEFKAISINIQEASYNMEDPYKGQKAISWTKFKEEYKRNIKIEEKKFKSDLIKMGSRSNSETRDLRMEIITKHNIMHN